MKIRGDKVRHRLRLRLEDLEYDNAELKRKLDEADALARAFAKTVSLAEKWQERNSQ